MPMVKITTHRQPWTDSRPLQHGESVDVTSEQAADLIASGFAELAEPQDAAPARRRRSAS